MFSKTPKMRRLPSSHLLQKELVEIDHPLAKRMEKSSHIVKVVRDVHQNIYFFKLNNKLNNGKGSDHKNSEYEAVAGELLNLVLGDLVSKPIGVYGENGERLGVASKPINGFQSIHAASEAQYLSSKKRNLPKQKLFPMGLATVLVLAYVFDENDLHLRNIGFDHQGRIVKIDHNQSFISLTHKYIVNALKETGSNVEIAAEDIATFPNLSKAHPSRWVIDEWRTSVLKSAHHDDAFNKEKYTAFLQCILLPRMHIREIANKHFTTETGANRFVNWFYTRLDTLETELMKVPQFLQFLSIETSLSQQIFANIPEVYHVIMQDQLQKIQERSYELLRRATTSNNTRG